MSDNGIVPLESQRGAYAERSPATDMKNEVFTTVARSVAGSAAVGLAAAAFEAAAPIVAGAALVGLLAGFLTKRLDDLK